MHGKLIRLAKLRRHTVSFFLRYFQFLDTPDLTIGFEDYVRYCLTNGALMIRLEVIPAAIIASGFAKDLSHTPWSLQYPDKIVLADKRRLLEEKRLESPASETYRLLGYGGETWRHVRIPDKLINVATPYAELIPYYG